MITESFGYMPRNGLPVPYASCVYGGGGVCVDILGFMWLYAHADVAQKLMLLVFFFCPLPSLLRYNLSLYLDLTVLNRLKSSELHESFWFCIPLHPCHLISQTSPSIFFFKCVWLFFLMHVCSSHACLVPTEARREEDIGSLELELNLNGYEP